MSQVSATLTTTILSPSPQHAVHMLDTCYNPHSATHFQILDIHSKIEHVGYF